MCPVVAMNCMALGEPILYNKSLLSLWYDLACVVLHVASFYFHAPCQIQLDTHSRTICTTSHNMEIKGQNSKLHVGYYNIFK